MIGDFFNKNVSLGTAIRWVIICLIFVFDPLAVVLIVVSIHALTTSYGKIKKVTALEEKVALAEQQLSELSISYEKHVSAANQYMTEQNQNLKDSQTKIFEEIESELLNKKAKIEEELKNYQALVNKKTTRVGQGRNNWNTKS